VPFCPATNPTHPPTPARSPAAAAPPSGVTQDDQKNTLLHQLAAGQDNYGLVEALLQLGVDANAQNADGDTAVSVSHAVTNCM
jgi:ankyrin repeat protein